MTESIERCGVKGKCFAKGELGGCRCLVEPYKAGEMCPFQKTHIDAKPLISEKDALDRFADVKYRPDLKCRKAAVEWDALATSVLKTLVKRKEIANAAQ